MTNYENQGTGYDSGADGYELQGRQSRSELIDGTGWAEAAFADEPIDPVRALLRKLQQDRAFSDDVNHHPDALRGMGE